MKFTEHFGVTKGDADDWYDPFLEVDTKIFVDPFLLFRDTSSRWRGAHPRLIGFFNEVLKLIARSHGNHASAHWKKAAQLLLFPEPPEFCFGYCETGTDGAGSAEGLRNDMLTQAEAAIDRGIFDVEHFEELTLFGPQIGVDRISDIVCNVLKPQFIRYTQAVARKKGIALETVGVRHASWSLRDLRWEDGPVELPKSPYTGRGVILVPERFLREIPTAEQGAFWDFAWQNFNEELRTDFNYALAKDTDRQEIVRLARQRPDLVKQFMKYLEENPKPAYDFVNDPGFHTAFWELGKVLGVSMKTPPPAGPEEFCDFVGRVIAEFQHSVEDSDGWQLLWNGERPRAERSVQQLFRAVVVHYCKANDIDLTGEANAGRGPVDFKFSHGWTRRAVVEVKLANNSKYWHGLSVQTPQYMRSEEVDCGYFVTLQFTSNDLETTRTAPINGIINNVETDANVKYRSVWVDARRKPSASSI